MRRIMTRSRISPPRKRRTRDAAATRAAILASAHRAFVRAGYDGVGVREIAKGAGVTAMLVNRYFGSKEALFAEVVAGIMAKPIVLTGATLASPDGGAMMARALVAITAGHEPLDGFQLMCRSAGSERAAAIGRKEIEAHYHRALAAALPGDHAAERAALLLSFVAGVQIMRQMIGLSALKRCPPDVLSALLRPAFEVLWKGAPAP